MIDYITKWLGNLQYPNQLNIKRSPQWPKVREEWLKEHDHCEACGTTNKSLLTVHHKIPVHIDSSLELDKTNFITLCESASHNCHLLFGHLLDWKSFNKNIMTDTAIFLLKIKNRP